MLFSYHSILCKAIISEQSYVHFQIYYLSTIRDISKSRFPYDKKKVFDLFFHRYTYDADNRLTLVETSNDDVHWEKDARYYYYKHGPLARTELGEYQVQGIDYAYTIHGWIKGVNADVLQADKDMGLDGELNTASNPNKYFARDAFGFVLGYYQNDYLAIKGSNSFMADPYAPSDIQIKAQPFQLFNGNISYMATVLPDKDNYTQANNYTIASHTIGNTYVYDKLNRIKKMWSFDNMDPTNHNWDMTGLMGNEKYHTQYNYDANGNILSLKRQSGNSTIGLMDDFGYNYNSNTDPYYSGETNNQLNYVTDQVNATSFSHDIDNQNADNYAYDKIGNLIRDDAEQIASIEWNAYGKIKSIKRDAGSTLPELEFGYDAGGNRLYKIVKPGTGGNPTNESDWSVQWYVRDGSGNPMAIYQTVYEVSPTNSNTILGSYHLSEHFLYGSSRLGTSKSNSEKIEVSFDITQYTNLEFDGISNWGIDQIPSPTINLSKYVAGDKSYGLTNHLGSILATVTDRKVGVKDLNGIIEYFNPEYSSFTQYYPFGMRILELSYIGRENIFGFNGQELDDEVYGRGNSYSAEFWQYNSRLGRRWNIDPIVDPSSSSYSCFNNNPNIINDKNGKTPTAVIGLIVGTVQAGVDLASQTISNGVNNKREGKGFFEGWKDNIDWADVGISFAEGFVGGTTLGASYSVSRWVAPALQAGIDYKGGDLDIAIRDKKLKHVLGDLAAGYLGGALGGAFKKLNFKSPFKLSPDMWLSESGKYAFLSSMKEFTKNVFSGSGASIFKDFLFDRFQKPTGDGGGFGPVQTVPDAEDIQEGPSKPNDNIHSKKIVVSYATFKNPQNAINFAKKIEGKIIVNGNQIRVVKEYTTEEEADEDRKKIGKSWTPLEYNN